VLYSNCKIILECRQLVAFVIFILFKLISHLSVLVQLEFLNVGPEENYLKHASQPGYLYVDQPMMSNY